MKRMIGFGLAMLILTSACGGDSTGPGLSTLGNGTFRAEVDGVNFSAVSATVFETPVGTGATIIAVGAGTANSTSIGFAWVDNGPGTYQINQAIGANATYNEGGGRTWAATGLDTGSGAINVTSRTANRVIGTFSFVVVAAGGGATGIRTISDGSFDLTF